jgi:two-component system C4-dicarboxylate transport sensor histidine kinase DctB
MDDRSPKKSLSLEAPVACLEDILLILRHQLGNSVNALKVTLEVLHENFDRFSDEKKKEYLERALEVLGRQQIMVDAMRAYSNVNVNESKPIEFLSFWEQFLITLHQRTEKVTVIQNLQTGLYPVMGNPIAIQTVLIQLVENALDAVEGIENPRIEMSVTSEDGYIRIDIRDNGYGIQEKIRSKIFVPLFTTKPKRKGLGLSISLKLTTQMGGRLDIAPLAKGGAAATLWLQQVGGENHG